MTNALEYYAAPAFITDTGEYSNLLDDLPTDIAALRDVVQGLVIHIFWAHEYKVHLSPESRAEVQLRQVRLQLKRILELNSSPLTVARRPGRRLVGNCRDFSVLLTAFLRHQGVPARARCGFGRYFLPHHYEDHWVCEYWNAEQKRWVLVDAQLDELQRKKLDIRFDPLDVPRDAFVVGGKAWQLCRSQQADPDTFGIHDMHGLWFVRGDFVRDVAALNKVELLPWDGWGLAEGADENLAAQDLDLLDQLAELTCEDVPQFDAVRALYENNSRLRVPGTIHSYVHDSVQNIELGDFAHSK